MAGYRLAPVAARARRNPWQRRRTFTGYSAAASVAAPPLAGTVDFLTPSVATPDATVFAQPGTATVTLPPPSVGVDPGVRAAPGWMGLFTWLDRNPSPSPTAATMTLALAAPSVTTTSGGASVNVTGAPLTGTVNFLAPSVTTSDNTGATVSAVPLAGTVDFLVPVVTTSSGPGAVNVTVNPPGLTGTLVLVAPTVTATVEGAVVAPAALTLALSLPAPTIRITPDTPRERVHRARRYGRRRNWS